MREETFITCTLNVHRAQRSEYADPSAYKSVSSLLMPHSSGFTGRILQTNSATFHLHADNVSGNWSGYGSLFPSLREHQRFCLDSVGHCCVLDPCFRFSAHLANLFCPAGSPRSLRRAVSASTLGPWAPKKTQFPAAASLLFTSACLFSVVDRLMRNGTHVCVHVGTKNNRS